jgi:hypothetical protein
MDSHSLQRNTKPAGGMATRSGGLKRRPASGNTSRTADLCEIGKWRDIGNLHEAPRE